MDHLLYFPDLAPADFWLFPKLKGVCWKESVSQTLKTLNHMWKKNLTALFRIFKTLEQ
jgi:hypothetical protein